MATENDLGDLSRSQSRTTVIWQQFRKHKIALVGGSFLILMYIVTIFAGFLAPYGINEYRRFPITQYHPPTKIHWTNFETGKLVRPFVYVTKSQRDPKTRQRVYIEDTSKRYPIKFFVRRPEASYKILGLFKSDLHLFGVDEPARIFLWGTNNLGKDVFSRVLYGGQVSLTIGILAVWVAFFLGLFFGGLAGYYGGWVDELIMRFVEVLDAIPGLYLLIVLSSLLRDPKNSLFSFVRNLGDILSGVPLFGKLGSAMTSFGSEMGSAQIYLMIVMVFGFIGWGGLARTVRSILLSARELDYAQAAKALGASERRIIWQHLLPTTASYVIVALTLAIPGFILGETGLSFIGLGPSEIDTASWGLLLKDATARGAATLHFTPWLLVPGIPIFMAVLCWNLVGDGLRDAFDPRKRQ